jgi:hypothetical protein
MFSVDNSSVSNECYFDRLLLIRYDGRFRGYGRNKIIHLFHLYVLGFKFMVHPLFFLMDNPHKKSKSWEATFGEAKVIDNVTPLLKATGSQTVC